LDLDDVFQRRTEVLSREIDSGLILVDMAGGRCWELNEVGAFLWNAIGSPIPLHRVCSEIVQRFDVSDEIAKRDIVLTLGELLSAGLVARVR
jgi:hypothetical protein